MITLDMNTGKMEAAEQENESSCPLDIAMISEDYACTRLAEIEVTTSTRRSNYTKMPPILIDFDSN